jgi:hypothetical protein
VLSRAGLGQIATNAMTGQRWDKGLLLNVGLSLLTEGATAGVRRGVGWVADRANAFKQTLGNKIQAVSGWAQEKLAAAGSLASEGWNRFKGWASDQVESVRTRIREERARVAAVELAAQLGNVPERVSDAIIKNLEPGRKIAIQGMKPAAGPLHGDGAYPYKHIQLKNQKSDAQGYLRDPKGVLHISDPDIMVVIEDGHIVSDPYAVQLADDMNTSWRGRQIDRRLAVQRGPMLVEPKDPFQHSQRATYFTQSDSASHRNIANEMPNNILVYELDSQTGLPTVSLQTDSVSWIQSAAYAEDLSWYPWASDHPGGNPALNWDDWYDYVGSRR